MFVANIVNVVATRKSWVNARGILPATYQVLHLLSYPGGTPALAGIPPHPDLAGYPPSHLDLPGVPPPPEGTWDQSLGYPPHGKDMEPLKVIWDGDGVPPPPGVNRHL